MCIETVAIVGGVSANSGLRAAAEALARHLSLGLGTTSERAAELLVVLAQFYQERQMAPLWLEPGNPGTVPSTRARTLAAVLRAATLTIGGTSYVINSVTLSPNNQVEMRANGRPVAVPASSTAIAYEISPAGARPLPVDRAPTCT